MTEFMTEYPQVDLVCLHTFQETIDAFLAKQTFTNFDIISFSETDTYDDLITYLKETKSKYICFLEDNHIYSENKVEKMLLTLEEHRDADICICYRDYVDEYESIIAHVDAVIEASFKNIKFRSKEFLELCIAENKNFYGDLSSIMISSELIKKISWNSLQYDDERISKTSLLFHVLASGVVAYIDSKLVSVKLSKACDEDIVLSEYKKMVADLVKSKVISIEPPSEQKTKKNIAKEITFFYSDKGEYYNLEPIAREAERRGYSVIFTDNLVQKAEIGVYCQHVCRPENSKFSVILLHDMAQGHNRWPNIWEIESWNGFDIGVLPGTKWADLWSRCANQYYVNPRLGTFLFGYPKSDYIYSEELKNRALWYKKHFNLKYNFSVLYAPSWENDEKEDDFVRALASLPVNLLIKQAHWPKEYGNIIENIRVMREMHEGKYENLYFIEPEESIMTVLEMCDLVVSDESSVMVEAGMFNKPSVAVYDWLIPDTNPSRFASVPMEHIIKCKKVELRETVQNLLYDKEFYKKSLSGLQETFSNKGNVCNSIMDAIDYYLFDSEKDDFMKHKLKSKYAIQSMWN